MSRFDSPEQKQYRVNKILALQAWLKYDENEWHNPFTKQQMTSTTFLPMLPHLLNDLRQLAKQQTAACLSDNEQSLTINNIIDKLRTFIQSDEFNIDDFARNETLCKAFNEILQQDFSIVYAKSVDKNDCNSYLFWYVVKRYPQVLTKQYFNMVGGAAWLFAAERSLSRQLWPIIDEQLNKQQQQEAIGLLSSNDYWDVFELAAPLPPTLQAIYNKMYPTLDEEYPCLQEQLLTDYIGIDIALVNYIYKQYIDCY